MWLISNNYHLGFALHFSASFFCCTYDIQGVKEASGGSGDGIFSSTTLGFVGSFPMTLRPFRCLKAYATGESGEMLPFLWLKRFGYMTVYWHGYIFHHFMMYLGRMRMLWDLILMKLVENDILSYWKLIPLLIYQHRQAAVLTELHHLQLLSPHAKHIIETVLVKRGLVEFLTWHPRDHHRKTLRPEDFFGYIESLANMFPQASLHSEGFFQWSYARWVATSLDSRAADGRGKRRGFSQSTAQVTCDAAKSRCALWYCGSDLEPGMMYFPMECWA